MIAFEVLFLIDCKLISLESTSNEAILSSKKMKGKFEKSEKAKVKANETLSSSHPLS